MQILQELKERKIHGTTAMYQNLLGKLLANGRTGLAVQVILPWGGALIQESVSESVDVQG